MSTQDILDTNLARTGLDMTAPTLQVTQYMTFGYLDQCLDIDGQIIYKRIGQFRRHCILNSNT